jgi:transposase
MSESSPTDVQRIEVITSVQCRRRCSVSEKIEIVEETEQPGMGVLATSITLIYIYR